MEHVDTQCQLQDRAAGASPCRVWMRWREFSSCSIPGDCSEAGKSVRGFVPRSMPLEDRWAVPRFLPGLGGASGCTSTGLLVLFPLNLRQSPPDNPKGKGLGTPGEPRKPWLSSAFRTGGLCRTGRRLQGFGAGFAKSEAGKKGGWGINMIYPIG